MFLEISQNSQKNTRVRVYFLIKLQTLCLRTPFLQNTSGWLLLYLKRSYLQHPKRQLFNNYFCQLRFNGLNNILLYLTLSIDFINIMADKVAKDKVASRWRSCHWSVKKQNIGIRFIRGHSHIEYSHSLRQTDANFQTHPPTTLHVKMTNLPKIDVSNFSYEISEGILLKLFFLLHRWKNKYVHISA